MSYNLQAKSISTSNHMFGRAIWDKLPKSIFENCPSKTKMIYTKIAQTKHVATG